jgi:hypothetical protein
MVADVDNGDKAFEPQDKRKNIKNRTSSLIF